MNMILPLLFLAGQKYLSEKLQTTETEKLLNMEQFLSERVIGQDEAIDYY